MEFHPVHCKLYLLLKMLQINITNDCYNLHGMAIAVSEHSKT